MKKCSWNKFVSKTPQTKFCLVKIDSFVNMIYTPKCHEVSLRRVNYGRNNMMSQIFHEQSSANSPKHGPWHNLGCLYKFLQSTLTLPGTKVQWTQWTLQNKYTGISLQEATAKLPKVSEERKLECQRNVPKESKTKGRYNKRHWGIQRTLEPHAQSAEAIRTEISTSILSVVKLTSKVRTNINTFFFFFLQMNKTWMQLHQLLPRKECNFTGKSQ